MQKRIHYTLMVLLVLAGFYGGHLSAQCEGQAMSELDINEVRATFHNGGDMFWDRIGNPKYEVPKGSGKHSNFAGAMWLGALDNGGQLFTAAHTYRQSGNDFFPGPVRIGSNYECDTLMSTNASPIQWGLFPLASGKFIVFSQGAFSVVDPATNVSTQYLLPSNRTDYRPVQLPNGDIMLVGDPTTTYPNPSPMELIDTATFAITNGPTLNYYHRFSSVTTLNNGKILICGFLGTEEFDPVTNTSTMVAQPPSPRHHHSAKLLSNGQVIISGGSTAGLNFAIGTNYAAIYDPGLGTWTNLPTMSANRVYHDHFETASGTVLILGGDLSTGSVDEYDPVANTMTSVANLPFPTENLTAVSVAPDELVLFGQSSQNSWGGKTGSLFYLDPTSMTVENSNWRAVGSEVAEMPDGSIMTQTKENASFYRKYFPVSRTFDWARWQKVWRVSQTEINQFLIDRASGTIDWDDYPDIQSWPAHGNQNLGEDLHLAPFVDVDNNGRYRPALDGDYPCITGDQMVWTIFNDDANPHTETGGVKMGLQIEFSAYAFDCGSGDCPGGVGALDYTTFYHYEIINKSQTPYRDFYMGYFDDIDVGNYADDYVGCDTALNLAYGYNGAAVDATASGYGNNPPAIGSVILQEPSGDGMSSFVYYENDFSNTGNPQTPLEYYNYLRSLTKNGTPFLDPNGNASLYAYPGDAGFCGGQPTGWTEVSAANNPFDRRWVQNMGPYPLLSGDTLVIDIAMVWSRGLYNDNLGSVCELKSDVADVTNWWQGQDFGCFNLTVGRNEGATAVPQTSLNLFPNPSTGMVGIKFDGKMERVEVLDLTGKLVHSQTDGLPLRGGQLSLNLKELPGGMYIVRVTSERSIYSQKLILSP